MMYRYKNTLERGFSLVELMVVLAITAVLLSLTGGMLQKNIAQQERIVELEKINQLIYKLSFQAYYGEGPYFIRFQENKILINEAKITEAITEPLTQEITFKQLTFVAQDYTISSKGVVFPGHYRVINKDNIKQFQFKALFNESYL